MQHPQSQGLRTTHSKFDEFLAAKCSAFCNVQSTIIAICTASPILAFVITLLPLGYLLQLDRTHKG